MTLHPHTILLNYVIGLCKGNKNWASTLRDLHYDVEIIEQSIRTSSGQLVKPDIIKVSKRNNHALIIDCKSGSVDNEQMQRYGTLRREELLRWVDVPSTDLLTFDVCIADLEINHGKIAPNISFPIITFSRNAITRSNSFSIQSLNQAFSNPIDITGMIPPLDYYPFSENDSDFVIVPRILRTIVSLTMKRARGAQSVLNEEYFETDDVLKHIHPLWKSLSEEHKNILREKIKDILRRLIHNYSELAQHMSNIQREGYRLRGPTESFTKLCEKILDDFSPEGKIDQFLES